MINLEKRAPEVANLLNPAFCSLLLYATIYEYQKKAKNGFPYTLTYLVLPLVLHKSTRERIDSRTNMVVFTQRHPDVLVGFPGRARSLIPFANEALDFLFFREIVTINATRLTVEKTISKTGVGKYAAADQEIADCIRKAEHVGRWFAQMGAEENIYTAWGVKP